MNDKYNSLKSTALSLAMLEEYETSEKILSQLIEYNHTDEQIYMARSVCRFELGNHIGAIQDNNMVIDINPNNGAAYSFRGRSKVAIDNIEDGFNDLNMGIQLLSDSHIPYLNRASSYLLIKNPINAVNDLTKCLEYDNRIPIVYLLLGEARLLLNQFHEAKRDLLTALPDRPNDPFIYLNLSAAEAGLDNFQMAEGYLYKCLLNSKKKKEIFAKVGHQFYNISGRVEKSICCLRVALLMDQNDSSLQFSIGNYYSIWTDFHQIEDTFFDLLGEYKDMCKRFFIDAKAFAERVKIAKGFYASSFQNLMPFLRTDITSNQNDFYLFLFYPNNKYCLNPLLNKSFHFSDIRNWPDKTDSPLLNPINQTNLAINISYENVVVRCLCDCDYDGKNGIERCPNVWERYTNHSGIAYRLRISKSWLLENDIYINKIKYIYDRPVEINAKSPEDVIQDGLFVKHTDYEYEREWRLIKFGAFSSFKGEEIEWGTVNQNPPTTNGIGVSIESIYLGIDIDTALKERIIEISTDEKINVFQMMLCENGMIKAKEL